MELNPEHPVTKEVRTEWHKLCGILMQKLGQNAVEITVDDVQRIANWNIVADARGGKFILRLVDDAEARRLVREAGG